MNGTQAPTQGIGQGDEIEHDLMPGFVMQVQDARRIEGSGDDEHYQILVGDEDRGWTPQKALKFAGQQAAADRDGHDEFVTALLEHAPGEWDDDAAAESIAFDYVRHLEGEVDRLGGSRRPAWAADDAGPAGGGS